MIKFSSKMWSASKVFGACAVAAAAILVPGVAQGQGYSTSFDNLTPNETLSGQDSWDTNDNDNGAVTSGGQTIGQSDFVGVINNYSASGTDYYAYLGGLAHATNVPGTSPVFLYRPFTLGATTAYAFNVDMSISSSTTYPGRDTFAWNFRNTAGTSIFSVNFDPVAGTGNPFAVRYTTSLGGATETTTNNGIISNSIYHLTVSVNVATNMASIALTPTGGTATTIASNILVPGISTVTQVAAEWTIASGTTNNGGLTGAGGNALLFNNYGVTVPEPSTYAMIGLGLVAVAVYGRRRARA